VRQYDHEVQAGSVVKPLTGKENDGPTDAAVVRPDLTSMEGVVVSHGICPKYSDYDGVPDGCMRHRRSDQEQHRSGGSLDHMPCSTTSAGATPSHPRGNPDGEYKLAQLVRANKALYDYTVLFQDALHLRQRQHEDDYVNGDTRISIPPTLLMSAISRMPDVRKP